MCGVLVRDGVARTCQTDSLRYIVRDCGGRVSVFGVVRGGCGFGFAEFEAGEVGGAVGVGHEGGGVTVGEGGVIGGVAVFEAGELAGGRRCS